MPSILFVHDHHPGQFGALAKHLLGRGWTVTFATAAPAPGRAPWPVIAYQAHRPPSPATHPYAQGYERAALQGQACLRALIGAGLAAPDIVVSHAGPGAGLYLRDLYPASHIVAYCEWWYESPGPDIEYLRRLNGDTAAPDPETRLLARARNLSISAELLAADRGLCPTGYQLARFPAALRPCLTLRHDGIDTDFFSPAPVRPRRLDFLGAVPADAPLLTYATRGMEPHRCFPQVIRAFAAVLARHPAWHAVIAGGTAVHYGSDADRRTDWEAWAVERLGACAARVHFTGPLPRRGYLDLLRRSDAHVYATVPFVLSWSLIEAMAAGSPLVASRTAPVLEFLGDDTARLFDPASQDDLVRTLEEVVGDPAAARRRAARAREEAIDRCAAARLLPENKRWLREGL